MSKATSSPKQDRAATGSRCGHTDNHKKQAMCCWGVIAARLQLWARSVCQAPIYVDSLTRTQTHIASSTQHGPPPGLHYFHVMLARQSTHRTKAQKNYSQKARNIHTKWPRHTAQCSKSNGPSPMQQEQWTISKYPRPNLAKQPSISPVRLVMWTVFSVGCTTPISHSQL